MQNEQTHFEGLNGESLPNQWQGAIHADILPFSPDHSDSVNCAMFLATYVEKKFIPDHVAHMTRVGRVHYQSMLKHVLNPELVVRMFGAYTGMTTTRLKPMPDWPYLDDVRLCDLNSDHVRQLTASATEHGYSTQTIKHIRSVVGAVMSHARRNGLFNRENPITDVHLAPMVRSTSPNLTILQAKAILRLMKYPEREIALITITTGMSISEICGLQLKHVNLTHAPHRSDGEVIPPRCMLVKQQWNAKELREVPSARVRKVEIPEPLFRRFLTLKREKGRSDPDCFLLASPSGEPLSPAGVLTVRLKPIGRKLGMPWLSWRVLKRAHQALLSELRIQLNDDLVLSAR